MERNPKEITEVINYVKEKTNNRLKAEDIELLAFLFAGHSLSEIAEYLNLSKNQLNLRRARLIKIIYEAFGFRLGRQLPTARDLYYTMCAKFCDDRESALSDKNDSNLSEDLIFKQRLGRIYRQQKFQALELEIEIPDDTPPEKVKELIKQAALRADMTHRSLGGNGLTVNTVEVTEKAKSLNPSGR